MGGQREVRVPAHAHPFGVRSHEADGPVDPFRRALVADHVAGRLTTWSTSPVSAGETTNGWYPQELLVAVPRLALGDDPAGGDI